MFKHIDFNYEEENYQKDFLLVHLISLIKNGYRTFQDFFLELKNNR